MPAPATSAQAFPPLGVLPSTGGGSERPSGKTAFPAETRLPVFVSMRVTAMSEGVGIVQPAEAVPVELHGGPGRRVLAVAEGVCEAVDVEPAHADRLRGQVV